MFGDHISTRDLLEKAGNLRRGDLQYLQKKFPRQLEPAGYVGRGMVWYISDVAKVKMLFNSLNHSLGRPRKSASAKV